MELGDTFLRLRDYLVEWPVWDLTRWMSETGVTGLLAAIGTVAATSFAVWQAGATGRERRETAKASANAALWGIEDALDVLNGKDFTATYMGAQCRGVLNTLMEIPVTQLGTSQAVRALVRARAALHVIADRVDASRQARMAGNRLAGFIGLSDQVAVLEAAATELRQCLGSSALRRDAPQSTANESPNAVGDTPEPMTQFGDSK